MKAEAKTLVIEAEPLVTKPRLDVTGQEQGREKVTLRVAITATFEENLRRCAGNRREPMVSGMENFISNPFKATTSDGHGIRQVPPEGLSLNDNGRMLPVDDLG